MGDENRVGELCLRRIRCRRKPRARRPPSRRHERAFAPDPHARLFACRRSSLGRDVSARGLIRSIIRAALPGRLRALQLLDFQNWKHTSMRKALALFLSTCMLYTALAAQTTAPAPRRQQSTEDEEVVRITSSLVQTDVVVTDKDGKKASRSSSARFCRWRSLGSRT
jgi:hypothetical protein